MQIPIRNASEPDDFTALDSGNTLYVYLCSGEIVEVTPVTAVRVTDRSVVALDGQESVATFRRCDVYFAADEKMQPPSL